MNEPIVGVNLPATISAGFKNVSNTKNKINITTPSDAVERTDKNVSIITEPVLQNSFTTVSELTSDNIVTDVSDSSDETETASPVTLTLLDVEIQTSTVNPKQKEDFNVTTTENPTAPVQNNTYNDSNLDDKNKLGTTYNNSYPNKKPDLEIHIINTNSIHFNNQQRYFKRSFKNFII